MDDYMKEIKKVDEIIQQNFEEFLKDSFLVRIQVYESSEENTIVTMLSNNKDLVDDRFEWREGYQFFELKEEIDGINFDISI